MSLRPYQEESLQTSRDKYKAGVTRQLIALPTGTGKTVVFASIRRYFEFQNRMMFLVHREELAQQAADKLRKWNPGVSVGVEMGDRWASPSDMLVVASVQTLGRQGSPRLARFNPNEFDAVVCDEAHHSTASTYRTVFSHFGLMEPYSKRLLLGVTATPNRGDGVPLGEIYDEIVYQMTIFDAIQQGWLVDFRGIRVCTKTSLDAVRTQAGDFKLNELGDAVNNPQRNDLIVREWLKHGQNRSTIVFTVDIQHANELAAMFKQYGVAAEAVWGDDPQRADKLRFHRAGHLRVLCNCGVLTEGYDDPNVACIVLARPTKSNLLFVQMAGRGTRLPEGISNLKETQAAGIPVSKEDCLLMDVVDNTSRHSLITLTSIFGLGNKLDLKGQKATEAVKKFSRVQREHPELDLNAVEDFSKLDSYVEQVNLFQVKYPEAVTTNSLLQWHQNSARDSFVLLLPGKEEVVITTDLLGKYHIVGSVNGNKFQDECADLPEAFRRADGFVTMFGNDMITLLRRESKWMENPATPKQLALLRKFRVPFPPGISKGEASRKINQLLAQKRKPVPTGVPA